ncbi:hypothetical protein XarjCFBP7653_17170 [Xanthomonas arboricola]|nr:hypothetical protein XarjCFBP7653_17170 [Xanthomonas arboricola]
MNKAHPALLLLCVSTISTGPCPLTVAGPYAAWMPRKSLQGRTYGVSCDGGRARTLQPQLPHTALDAVMIDCAQPARLDSAFTPAKAAGDRSQ